MGLRFTHFVRRLTIVTATLSLSGVMVVGLDPHPSGAARITKSTPQSERDALRGARWSANVKISYPASGEWRFASNGLPAYGLPRYYAVPNFLGPAVPTRSNSSVVATSTLEKARGVSYTLPLTPRYSSRATTTALGPIGITVDGALFFNAYEANDTTIALASNFTLTRNGHVGAFVDSCNGHFTPAPSLIYHYHGLPTCIVRHVTTTATKNAPVLLGFAFDGYGIYDNVAEGGSLVKPGTLDACNGIFSVVPGYPQGVYHYVVFDTPTRQSSIGCYHGVVSSAYTAALWNEVLAGAGRDALGGAAATSAVRPSSGAVTAKDVAASSGTDAVLVAELENAGFLHWCD